MADVTLYQKSFPSRHWWLVEEKLDVALKALEGLPEWTGTLSRDQCVVIVKLVPHRAVSLVSPCCHKRMQDTDPTCPDCKELCIPVPAATEAEDYPRPLGAPRIVRTLHITEDQL